MSESDERPESVEDDARVDHAVVVELSEVLDSSDSLLIVLEAVNLSSVGGQLGSSSSLDHAHSPPSRP